MSTATKWLDRAAGGFVRWVERHRRDVARRDHAGALRAELQRRATVAAADFVMERMPGALFCADKFDHLSYALGIAPPGLALEFGVFKGTTINHLARLQPHRHFVGFDSFRGLPEHWTGSRYSRVNFDRKGQKPKVASNVTLVEGWFDQTLPEFLAVKDEPIGFVMSIATSTPRPRPCSTSSLIALRRTRSSCSTSSSTTRAMSCMSTRRSSSSPLVSRLITASSAIPHSRSPWLSRP